MLRSLLLIVGLWLLPGCVAVPARGCAERLFVFEIGQHHTDDVSRWSPGVDVGRPRDFANHCYLIQHARGLLLWDTGYPDAIAAEPDGLLLPGGVRIRVTRTLADSLASVGVAPAAITHLALSHLHLDHAGNCGRFANATIYLQQEEHDAALGPAPGRLGYDAALVEPLRERRLILLRGDHDVFGDGSVIILATPGHTPGHQSLLVRLPRAGAVLLAGDAAHFRGNWDHRRVPLTNFDRVATLRSLDRLRRLVDDEHALLLLGHDGGDHARLPRPPAFLD